jgi:hypothetical protein
MSQTKNTILESWPELKDDLESFLSDTDAWIISELKKAREAEDWTALDKLVQVMEFVHDMNHEH